MTTKSLAPFATLVLILVLFLACLAVFAGCPKPMPNPAPVPPDLNGIPFCDFDAGSTSYPTNIDMCLGRVTDVMSGSFQCVACGASVQGCIDKVDMVYCVSMGCDMDSRCSRNLNPKPTRRTK